MVQPQPVQHELPFATVRGEPLTVLPEDLYIPPDALEVFLEAFSGPLDLLLYLIRRQNFDIRDIPVAHITEQYMAYVELMRELKLDLAAEYLVMAAWLAEIKSRLSLPRPPALADEEEQDPRAQLMRRLQEYEQCQRAAEQLDALPCLGRDHFVAQTVATFPKPPPPVPEVTLKELLLACQAVLQRAAQLGHHQIQREPLSIRARMAQVLDALRARQFVPFTELFTLEEGRRGVVVTLMAILELLKSHLVDVVQGEGSYAPLYVQAVAGSDDAAA